MTKEIWGPMVIALAIASVVFTLIIFAVKDHTKWVAQCEQMGGHVTSKTSHYTAYDSTGKPSTGSDTTYYCLSSTGGILDIR